MDGESRNCIDGHLSLLARLTSASSVLAYQDRDCLCTLIAHCSVPLCAWIRDLWKFSWDRASERVALVVLCFSINTRLTISPTTIRPFSTGVGCDDVNRKIWDNTHMGKTLSPKEEHRAMKLRLRRPGWAKKMAEQMQREEGAGPYLWAFKTGRASSEMTSSPWASLTKVISM